MLTYFCSLCSAKAKCQSLYFSESKEKKNHTEGNNMKQFYCWIISDTLTCLCWEMSTISLNEILKIMRKYFWVESLRFSIQIQAQNPERFIQTWEGTFSVVSGAWQIVGILWAGNENRLAYLLQIELHVEINKYWLSNIQFRIWLCFCLMQSCMFIHPWSMHTSTHSPWERWTWMSQYFLPFPVLLTLIINGCTNDRWHTCSLVIYTGTFISLSHFRWDCFWGKSIVFSITKRPSDRWIRGHQGVGKPFSSASSCWRCDGGDV